MIKDATRRALRVVRKARKALPASPQATPSSSILPLPKLVKLPVPRHPKSTVPSLSRLLGRPVQPPPPKKEKKKQAANAQEDGKTRDMTTGVVQALDEPPNAVDALSGVSGVHQRSSSEPKVKGEPPATIVDSNPPSTPALSTGFAKENWFSEPWDKGVCCPHFRTSQMNTSRPSQLPKPQEAP
jgi:hypothetical protein